MPVSQPQILLPIVIEIRKAAGPAKVVFRSGGNASGSCHFIEEAAGILLEQRKVVVEEGGGENADAPAIIKISYGHAHIRLRPPIGVHGNSAFQTRFFECTVALVYKQKVRIGIVSHKQIDLAIVIEIVED